MPLTCPTKIMYTLSWNSCARTTTSTVRSACAGVPAALPESSAASGTARAAGLPLPGLLLVLGVVVPGGPAGVEAHVGLALEARQVVVLCLLLPAERVPLKGKRARGGVSRARPWRRTHRGRRPSPASASSSSGRSGSCRGRSSAGTSACAAAAPRAPSRNTWPAPREKGRATAGGKEGLVLEFELGRGWEVLRQHDFPFPFQTTSESERESQRTRGGEHEVSHIQSGIFCLDGGRDRRTAQHPLASYTCHMRTRGGGGGGT